MEKSFIVIGFIAGAVSLIGTGCTNIEASKVGDQVQVQMPVLVKPTVETKDTVINGSATVHSILGIFSWGPNAQAVGVDYGVNSIATGGVFDNLLTYTSKSEIVARNAAAYEATTSAKADIILAPQYVLTTKDYFVYKSINCKVKGFPGYVKGVKIIDPQKEAAK
ncbi:hypothetical protein KH017_17940 [bacterium]|nr:hypothetical protein [bacterium]